MRTKRNRTHGSAKQLQRRAVRIGTLATCFVVIAGCQPEIGLPSSTPAAGNVQQQVKSVNVIKVAKQKIGETPELTADLISSLQADVIVKSGGMVEQVLKKRGDPVVKGEVILTLGSQDLHMQKERAALAVTSAEQAIEKSKRDIVNDKAEIANSVLKLESELAAQTKQFNKLRNDYDVGLASRSQVEQAESQLKSLRMDLELLKQKQRNAEAGPPLANLELQLKNAQLTLRQAEQALESLEVKASMNGILAELAVEEGMTVEAGVRVGHILHLERLMVKAQLNEEAAKLVRGRSELMLAVPSVETRVKAKVSYLSAFMNSQSKGYELNLEVDNKEMSLKPGTKVRIQLAEEQDQFAIAIPSFSIVREGEEAYIFVVSGDLAEKRKVQLGRINEPLQEILSGVQEGELLVTSGQTLLKDRDSVKVASTDGRK
jgi:HlyD family secretion protein